jgi:hypothetical protein
VWIRVFIKSQGVNKNKNDIFVLGPVFVFFCLFWVGTRTIKAFVGPYALRSGNL